MVPLESVQEATYAPGGLGHALPDAVSVAPIHHCAELGPGHWRRRRVACEVHEAVQQVVALPASARVQGVQVGAPGRERIQGGHVRQGWQQWGKQGGCKCSIQEHPKERNDDGHHFNQTQASLHATDPAGLSSSSPVSIGVECMKLRSSVSAPISHSATTASARPNNAAVCSGAEPVPAPNIVDGTDLRSGSGGGEGKPIGEGGVGKRSRGGKGSAPSDALCTEGERTQSGRLTSWIAQRAATAAAAGWRGQHPHSDLGQGEESLGQSSEEVR